MIDKFLIHQDDLAKAILNKYDIHMIPVVNPDGYEYTRNIDRAWRKNRSKNILGLKVCMGTDLNR